MANVPNAVEILLKITTAWVGCTSVTDDRQTTDGQATAYSKREREFTFAKNWWRIFACCNGFQYGTETVQVNTIEENSSVFFRMR